MAATYCWNVLKALLYHSQIHYYFTTNAIL